MHTELVCVGSDGKIYQWKWCEPEPYKNVDESGSIVYHPRTKSLGLTNETVVKLSACSSRASVLTLSGKVYTTSCSVPLELHHDFASICRRVILK